MDAESAPVPGVRGVVGIPNPGVIGDLGVCSIELEGRWAGMMMKGRSIMEAKEVRAKMKSAKVPTRVAFSHS